LNVSANEVLARLTEYARASIDHFVKISADGFLSIDLSSPEALDHLYLINEKLGAACAVAVLI
jgi:hypothetical protein